MSRIPIRPFMRYRLRVEQLQQLISASRLSQNHWAIKLGFSRGHWSDIVNGKHPYPSTRTRERLVEVLGVSFETLFEPQVTAGPGADVEFRAALSDRYLIDRELGQGAMGTVYLARDVAHGRLVAIKQMSREAVCGVGLTAFLREITVVSRLQHPNILPLFAAGAAADHPYFVMPWVRGGSLRDRLKRDLRLPVPQVRRLVDGLAGALSYAHAERVLHCDIKPENILLHGDHAWLTDFGISRILHAEASEWRARNSIDTSAGTPAYVSPEQANGEDELDGRADVYSLGCVVYEMLTGRAPFEGESTEIIVGKRFVSAPPPIRGYAPEVSHAVTAAVGAAMELRREQRTPNPEKFAEALNGAATTQSTFERTLTRASLAMTRTAGRVRRIMGMKPAFAFARQLSAFSGDLRYAWRQARGTPALTAVIVATLAIAIALTTTTYTVVDHVMLRPLVFANPDRLVALSSVDSTGDDVVVVSSANWRDWRASATTLEHTAIYATRRAGIRSDEGAVRVAGASVSGDFFRVIQPRFLLGRGFTEEEIAKGIPGVVVSERFWRRYLAADSTLSKVYPGVTGDVPVVGVVADGYEFPAETEVWSGMATPPEPPGTRNNINWWGIARLRPGVTLAQSKTDLARVSADIRASDRTALYAYGVNLTPLRNSVVGDAGSYLFMLLGAGTFVLLVACTNVAAANVGRGLARAREFAVRTAIGADRSRIFGQLLTEHVSVAIVGGALGIVLAWAALKGLVIAWGTQIPRASEIHLDLRVLLVAAAITMLSGVLSGLFPALLASRAPSAGLMASGSKGSARGGRNVPGAVLVGVQIALAMVLVCGSTLFIRSFQQLVSRDLGFNLDVATVEATLNSRAFRGDTARQFAYWTELREKLRALPGVSHAGLANWTPLAMAGTGSTEIAERPAPTTTTSFRVISDDYLEALGVKLLEGRTIANTDDASSEAVTVINERIARHFWPNESAIGKMVRSPSMEANAAGGVAPWRRVVGVVTSVRHGGFEAEVNAEMYVPWRQAVPLWIANMTVVASGKGVTERMLPAIMAAARAVNRDVAVEVGTLSLRAGRFTSSRRMVVTLLTAFGSIALLLTALGTYGLLAYGVAQRGREMAIRSALGATRRELMQLVFGGVGLIVAAGVTIGVVTAIGLSRFIESQLVDVSPTDRFAFVSSIAVVLATAVLATWIPARRAGRANPSDALRGD